MDEVSGMDFFVATELAHSILNDIVCAYSRLEFKEGRKQTPDFNLIREWDLKRAEVLKELYKSENFQSYNRMNEIIEIYTPILKKIMNLE